MPQNTNPYNTQNGMGSMSMGGPMGAWQPQDDPMQQPNNQRYSAIRQPQIPNDWRPYSPGPQMPSFNGKWVDRFEDIRPMDVPQDGSLTFFPMTDKSCIYAMTWGIDGRIMSFRFVPEKIEQTPPPSTTNDISGPFKELLMGFTNSISDRMDALEARVGDILNPFQEQLRSTQTKTTKKTQQKDGEQA